MVSCTQEHVERQEAAMLTAAAAQFAEQDFGDTNMADISGAVGLARNSL
jgi:AcrR family transcriptional regulator